MTDDMPRPKPQFLIRQVTRHGRAVWYFRRHKTGPAIRIRAEFGTPEFTRQYEAALIGQPIEKKPKTRGGSLRWLFERFKESSSWSSLALATRKQRENIISGVIAREGDTPAIEIVKADIVEAVDKRRNTPAQARNFIDAMRCMYRWAKAVDLVDHDPTEGIKYPKRPKGPGFEMWTEDELQAFERCWPIGTLERVWFDVLLYTGLRRGDAVRVGKQHVREVIDPESGDLIRVIFIKTEKTGREVAIPILPVLQATLDEGPTGDLAFICGRDRKPLSKEVFGNFFRTAARAAGVRKSPHGIRKAGATRCANLGASGRELDALFGWEGGQMSDLYTKAADRLRLAIGAVGKLAGGTPGERSIRTPARKVCGSGRKTKQ